MKLCDIIRQKRLEKGLTQEQVANLLGVSTPAVNKWEKDVSYPDITLLPPLARLLGTDLNTLLSFQEDLTPQEVGLFLNELCELAASQGIQTAFDRADEKLREFPACDLLLLNTALTLDGLVAFMAEEESGASSYRQTTEQLYRRAADSKEPAIANQAKALLVSRHMERHEWDSAQTLLDSLPDEPSYDKKQLQATLYTVQERWEDAALITERKLLAELTSLQSDLLTLMELAVQEEDLPRAKRMETAIQKMVQIFDLWDYNGHLAQFQLAVLLKDPEKGVAALKGLFSALEEPWDPGDSPFYCHIPKKENTEPLGALLLPRLRKELEDPQHPEYGFLHSSPELRSLLTP